MSGTDGFCTVNHLHLAPVRLSLPVNQYAASFYGPDALPATNQQYHNNAKKYKFNTKFLIDLLCSKMKNNCRSLADIYTAQQSTVQLINSFCKPSALLWYHPLNPEIIHNIYRTLAPFTISFYPRDVVSAVYAICYVVVAGCLSVTRRYCINTAKPS